MRITNHTCAIIVFLLGTVLNLAAWQRRGGPQFDPAAVERGQKEFVTSCGFCHGSSARGGQTGPDLIRSELVLGDEKGKQLGEYLKVGAPDKGMPKFSLTDQQVSDIATFLHRSVEAVAYDPRTGKPLWHAGLHANTSNAPQTYMLDGRQYIVVGAGDSLYAFTLQK